MAKGKKKVVFRRVRGRIVPIAIGAGAGTAIAATAATTRASITTTRVGIGNRVYTSHKIRPAFKLPKSKWMLAGTIGAGLLGGAGIGALIKGKKRMK